jgi:hypothetical protein
MIIIRTLNVSTKVFTLTLATGKPRLDLEFVYLPPIKDDVFQKHHALHITLFGLAITLHLHER